MSKTKKSQIIQLEFEHSAITFQEKENKEKKNFMIGWYMPIINRITIHHRAQLVNMLKPTLHFPIDDADCIS